MHTFMDSKLMAKLLRQALAERGIAFTHSDSLELVARQFGLANWNILSARIESVRLALDPLPMPDGWQDGSVSRDGSFRMGIDRDRPGCAVIESTPMADHAPRDAFGTLSQSFAGTTYRGAAVEVLCELSCEHLDGAGTIWARVDGRAGNALRFDNLLDQPGRALSGTLGWTSRKVVLDVPEEAQTIHFGFLMQGRGKLWARRFSVSRVNAQGKEAGTPGYRNERPTNLGFGAA